MIQSCPSCGTLYRHGETRVARRARCGACDETFALAVRRPYRIVALAPSPAAVSGPGGAGWTAGAVVLDPLPVSVRAGTTDLPPVDHAPPAAREPRRRESLPRPLAAAAPATAAVPEGTPWRATGESEPEAPVSDRAFDDVLLDSDAGRQAASWSQWTGWAAAGLAAGVAGHLFLGGPVWIGAGVGVAAGCAAAWGQRRWSLLRS